MPNRGQNRTVTSLEPAPGVEGLKLRVAACSLIMGGARTLSRTCRAMPPAVERPDAALT